MWHRKLLWGLWLGICVLLWILSDSPAVVYLFAASILLPALGILMNLFACRNIEVKVTADTVAQKGEPLCGKLIIKNHGLLPCAKVSIRLLCRNCFTGEETLKTFAVSAGGKKTEEIPVTLSGKYCGRLELTLENVICQDLFGLTNREIETGSHQTTLILPDIYPAELVFTDRMQMDPEGVEYSMTKAGMDPGDTFAIREYHPGDSVKNMHWKLSEKLDISMVRELGLPINHSLLLAFDASADSEELLPDAEKKDAMGCVYASIAQYLCDNQIPFRMLWYDGEAGQTQVQDVTETGDYMAALSSVLKAGADAEEMSVLARYQLETGNADYAHVIVVTACLWIDLVELLEAGRITMLLCGDAKDFGSSFTPDEAEQILRYIEV